MAAAPLEVYELLQEQSVTLGQAIAQGQQVIQYALTWKGRILPVARSKATASQSSTIDLTPSRNRLGMIAAMSGYLPVLFSLFRLQPHTTVSQLFQALLLSLLCLHVTKRHLVIIPPSLCPAASEYADRIMDGINVCFKGHYLMYAIFLPCLRKAGSCLQPHL